MDETCQTQVPGIFACGNVLQVHDLVDYVSEEAERAGLGAVAYVQGKLTAGDTVAAKPGNGVRYILPQQVHTGGEVDLFLRVTKPYGKCVFTVTSGEKVLATVKRIMAAPGEMEKLTVNTAGATAPICVSLEELA